jgi:hypothetical protein
MFHIDEGEGRGRSADKKAVDGLFGLTANETRNSREPKDAATGRFTQEAYGDPSGDAVLEIDSGLGGSAAGVSLGFGVRWHEINLVRNVPRRTDGNMVCG